jgi:hypothetical protein
MLKAVTLGGGYRQMPCDSSGSKQRPMLSVECFILVILVAIIDVQASILAL